MSEWPKNNRALAKLFGCSPESIYRYYRKLHDKHELVWGEDCKATRSFHNGRSGVLWHQSGALKLAKLCTKAGAQAFCREMGLLPHQRRLEDDSLRIIMAALEGITPYRREYVVRDYPYRSYRIDLYLPEYKIAIERDEDGHQSHARYEEEERQRRIEQQLSCQFIRFNPDEPGFNVGQVLNEIWKRILAHKSKQPGKEGQVLQSSSPASQGTPPRG